MLCPRPIACPGRVAGEITGAGSERRCADAREGGFNEALAKVKLFGQYECVDDNPAWGFARLRWFRLARAAEGAMAVHSSAASVQRPAL